MSALPKSVRAQADRANKLAAEYISSLNPTPPGGTPPGDAPGTDKIVKPTDPPAPTPDPTPPPPNDPPAGSVTQLAPETAEHKYKVLQGKYNAEVPRLQNTVREQDAKLRDLSDQLLSTQRLLASLAEQRSSAAAPASTVAAPAAPKSLIKDEEKREFGEDLIDVMRRVAREENAAILPEIDRRVAPVAQRANQAAQAVEQVGSRQAQSDQQVVLDLLGTQVPDYLKLNSDPAFLEWLDQSDPYAGRKRGVMLREAYQAHDGPRVVSFFKGYLKEHAVVTPPPAMTPAAAAPNVAPQRKLEQLVAPGSSPKTGTTVTQDGSGKRVWLRSEITQFYDSIQSGRFKGTPEQKKAMERDIFAAQQENRIR